MTRHLAKAGVMILEAGVAFHEVDVTTNPAALEYIEVAYAQVPVVVYEKDGSENHCSGLNPARIDQIISIETAAGGSVREA